MRLRIEESAQQRDNSLYPIQTLDSLSPIYIDGMCKSAGAMVLVRGWDFRQSVFLWGTQWGDVTPHIRPTWLLWQLKASLAHIIPRLRALRGKIHCRRGRITEWMLRSCYQAPTRPLALARVNRAGHTSDPSGCCGK